MTDTDGTTPAEATMAIDIIWNYSGMLVHGSEQQRAEALTSIQSALDDIAARATAAERERIRQLARDEAAKRDSASTSGAALRWFADLLAAVPDGDTP